MAAFWVKKNVDLVPWETVLILPQHTHICRFSIFFSREKMKFNCVQASLNIADHISYLHSTFKFTKPFFISFTIFPGKTKWCYLCSHFIWRNRGGGLSAAQDQCVRQKPEVCGSWAKLPTSTGSTRLTVSLPSLLLPLYAAGKEEKIRGSLGTGGKTPHLDIWLKLRSKNPAQ